MNEPEVITITPVEQPLAKQPELSIGERKELNKKFVTCQLPRVVACGHRLDLSRQPRHRNCETCWYAWFNSHGEVVQQLDEMLQTEQHGETLIVQLQGKKFMHRWRQFMSTVASWKPETNE